MDGGKFTNGDLERNFMAALANGASGKPSVDIDVGAYLQHLDAMEASDAEKLALLDVVANIMGAFVDIGFGVHPVQQACGQNAESDSEKAVAPPNLLRSEFSERNNE